MLSKEQLEKIANPGPVDVGGTQNPIVTQMAIELLESRAESLSLREQLAELKQQKPIGQVISCNGNKTLGWINDAPVGTLLFTAAKPAGG
ncbi:hypothetical protein [Yersinia sp. 1652 StPb PI]|uniref:hypothetical protein n=1 Tax=Yersinia sp. 1652 StPb PI TaxID=3061649 RepID=UPI00355C6CC9